MIEISNKQYRFLKKIKRRTVVYVSDLSPNEITMARYLSTAKCIKAVHRMDLSVPDVARVVPKSYQITQYGEAQLYTFKAKFYKWWIPVVISIFALIISVLALFGPFDI